MASTSGESFFTRHLTAGFFPVSMSPCVVRPGSPFKEVTSLTHNPKVSIAAQLLKPFSLVLFASVDWDDSMDLHRGKSL